MEKGRGIYRTPISAHAPSSRVTKKSGGIPVQNLHQGGKASSISKNYIREKEKVGRKGTPKSV